MALAVTPIKAFQAAPAEILPTLRAVHRRATPILLDSFRASGTRSTRLLHLPQRRVFLVQPILDAGLVRGAGLAFVERAVAAGAGAGGAGVARDDVVFSLYDNVRFEEVEAALATLCLL